jgi:hypothetical protein
MADFSVLSRYEADKGVTQVGAVARVERVMSLVTVYGEAMSRTLAWEALLSTASEDVPPR